MLNNMEKIKKYLFVLLTAIVVMCLTGCGAQNYSLQINDDDTCNFSVKMTINRDTYDLLESYDVDTDKLNREKNTATGTGLDDVDALFQETAAMFSQYGYEIIAVNDTIDIGFEATKKYATIQELNDEIKELNSIDLVGVNFEVTKNQTRYKTTYTCYGELNYILDKDIDMENEIVSDNFKDLFDTSQLTCQFDVIMPYSTSITATDGEAGTNGITWKNSYDDKNTVPVHIISEAKNNAAYIVTILIVAVVVIIVSIIGVRLFRRYKAKHYDDYLYDDDYDDEEE